MSFYCYIIYSKLLNKYYIGETNNIEERIELHNNRHFLNAFTSTTDDWELFFFIQCQSRSQARRIETHIKRMKSRKYIENIKKYPEISQKLLIKYK